MHSCPNSAGICWPTTSACDPNTQKTAGIMIPAPTFFAGIRSTSQLWTCSSGTPAAGLGQSMSIHPASVPAPAGAGFYSSRRAGPVVRAHGCRSSGQYVPKYVMPPAEWHTTQGCLPRNKVHSIFGAFSMEDKHFQQLPVAIKPPASMREIGTRSSSSHDAWRDMKGYFESLDVWNFLCAVLSGNFRTIANNTQSFSLSADTLARTLKLCPRIDSSATLRYPLLYLVGMLSGCWVRRRCRGAFLRAAGFLAS